MKFNRKWTRHRRRKHGGHGVMAPLAKNQRGLLGNIKLIKKYIFAHATTYTYINLKSKSSLISLNDNTSKSGTDFEKEKGEISQFG